MARTIMELLRQTRIPTGSTTEALTEAGRVSSTGKVQTATGPKRGNVLEEAQQAELLAQRGEMVGEAAAQEKLREAGREQEGLELESKRQTSRQSMQASKQRLDLMSKDILDDLERNKAIYTQDKKNLALESVAAAQRLSNDKYIYELEDIGRRQRLDSSLGMKEALNKAVFENQLAIAKDDYAFKALLEMDEAEFKKALAAFNNQTRLLNAGQQAAAAKEIAKLDAATANTIAALGIDTMMKIATAEAKATTTRGAITAVGDVATKAVANWPKSTETKFPTGTTYEGLESPPSQSPFTYPTYV